MIIFTLVACVCPSEDGGYSAADASKVWEYEKLGDGYCSDWKYLPEGGYPDHLSPGHALYRDDKIQECAARCFTQTSSSYSPS